MKYSATCAGLLVLLCAAEADAQRVLEEWRVRPSASPDAVVWGVAAVFWNPAQVARMPGRGEALLLDLRTPGAVAIGGVAAAAGHRLDERTTLAVGLEHVGVDDIEQTTTSPEGEGTFAVAETRLAAAASRTLGPRGSVGAMVQYTRLPEVLDERSVLAIGAGFRYQPTALPLHVAAHGVSDGDDAAWAAGLEYLPVQRWEGVALRADYGAAGGHLAPGVTHRLTATALVPDLASVSLGLVAEPDGPDASVQLVAAASLQLSRYRLAVVREQMPNDFGGAWNFAFSVGW